MYHILAITTGALFVFLVVRYLRNHLARQRFILRNGLTSAPNIDHDFTDFKDEYNRVRETGEYVAFLKDLLIRQPGRTATTEVDGQTWLLSSDPDNIKAIMATEAESMCVEPLRKGMLEGWVGDGMFGSDGKRWKVSRNLFKPMFSRAPISELRQWETHTGRFFDNLPKDGVTVDLQPMFKRLYFDASMETLLGQSANSQIPEHADFDVEKFEADFEAVMIGAFTKVFSMRSDQVAKDWQSKCDYIHSIFDKYIDRALEECKMGQRQSNASMLHNLIGFSQDKEFLRDQLINVFIGAKDTAGIGISFILFFLARHPRVYEKLRAEVATIGERPLTFELLKSMKYLQNVIAECLRIHSPVNIMLRIAKEDCTLPRGGGKDGQQPIFVAKGTRIEVSLAVLHRDPRLWGEDSEELRPERFDKLATKWEYSPFGGGARMCPAQQMMLTQYAYLLVRFAQKYSRIENRDPVEELQAELIFSQQSRVGVQVALYQ